MSASNSHRDYQAKVSGPEPEKYIALSKVREIVKQVMDSSNELTADSADYRIGQWAGAEKVGFAIDCHLTTHGSDGPADGDALEVMRLVMKMKYWVNNPSAWDSYDESMSAQLGIIVRKAETALKNAAPQDAKALAAEVNLPARASSEAGADLDSRNFYELCQEYRHFRGDAALQFEAIKKYLRTGALPWPSYDEPSATDRTEG